MPALDPIAVRVAVRFLADIEAGRRVAVEYQRRSEGLVPVGDDEDEDELDDDNPAPTARP